MGYEHCLAGHGELSFSGLPCVLNTPPIFGFKNENFYCENLDSMIDFVCNQKQRTIRKGEKNYGT